MPQLSPLMWSFSSIMMIFIMLSLFMIGKWSSNINTVIHINDFSLLVKW